MQLFRFIILFCSFSLSAETFQSSTNRTSLVELYSSQGCSSCPPAERWVSNLLNHKKLWIDFVPLVFHVDYWNQLGWHDPFSKPDYSQRQRSYHQQGMINSVYTPGFILNGDEWRSWFLRKNLPNDSKKAQILSATLNETKLTVKYKSDVSIILNIAILGFDINTDIIAGENSGRILTENFIVLSHQTGLSNNGEWQATLTTPKDVEASRYALAIWVNKPDKLTPLQATGGWIKF